MLPILALSLAMPLSGCASFGKPPVAVAPTLPDLDPRDVSKCDDPGVPEIKTVGEAVGALGATRVYAACEARKRQNIIATYKDLQKGLGGTP